MAVAVVAAPLALFLLDVSSNRLTANPVQEIEQQTGKAAYLLVLLSLAVTPLVRGAQLARLLPASWSARTLSRFRRIVGWGALGWALVHFGVFVGLDYGFSLGLIWSGVADKRFALVGLAALLPLLLRGLVPLARLGGDLRASLAWAALVPAAAALATLHYLWAVKVVTTKELTYALVTAALLATWAFLRISTRGGSRPPDLTP